VLFFVQAQAAGAVKPKKMKAEKKDPYQQPAGFTAASQNQVGAGFSPKVFQ